jgi:D-alanyl-D-alanine carboxypeptidase (penicillin-binding protein 5/6)
MRRIQVKRMIRVNIWIILAFSVCLPQHIFAHQQSSPFNASSVSALLMDADTGQILYSQNPHFRIQPASLAKLMTLFLIFDALEQGNIQLNNEVLISKKAVQAGGSKMYLREGNQVPLVELIKGIAVVSGNDACLAAAEWLYGGQRDFVDKMNQKLKRLKIQNSQFQTVDGWPVPDQYTTAYDMAMLAQAYIREHAEALQYHSLKEFSHENHILHNRNGLILQDPSVDGLKTGHVEEAGYHLLATAKREKQRFIAVVMGAEKIAIREKEAMQLLNFGFNNFLTVRLFHKGQILSHLPVSKGVKDRVGLEPHVDGVITIPVSQKESVSFEIQSGEQQEAPIQLDQKLGDAIISNQKNILKTVPLFATEQIQRAGFVKIALQTFEFIIAKHKISLLVIIILVCILGLQTWHIKRLSRQLKDRPGDENIIKERLEQILKPTEMD